MSWTVTYDASPEAKVKAGSSHALNRDRHLSRAPDLAAGFDFGHRNPNIDGARSLMNTSFVNDGQGGFREPVVTMDMKGHKRPPSAEVEDYRNSRLAMVVKPLRKDAVIMRGVMLQLDPKWFEEHCPDWRTDGLNETAHKYVQVQLGWACKEFGQHNVVGGSLDLDETSPHLQLSIVPVTRDGRLSQKDFFKGPSDFRRQREELCNALEQFGYEPLRTVAKRSRERLSSAQFGQRVERLFDGEAKIKLARDEVDRRSAEVRSQEASLNIEASGVAGLRAKAIEEGRLAGFEFGFEEGRAAAEDSVREDLIALDLLMEGDETPILPLRREQKEPAKKLSPARERYLSYSKEYTK